jgi:hypothetical protein
MIFSIPLKRSGRDGGMLVMVSTTDAKAFNSTDEGLAKIKQFVDSMCTGLSGSLEHGCSLLSPQNRQGVLE